jgi:hypothetical protein
MTASHSCRWTVWLANPGTQALPDLQRNVDPGFGRRRGQPLGVAEQQAGHDTMVAFPGSASHQ